MVSIMIMRETGMNRRLQTLEYILQSTGRFVFTLPHTVLYMHLVSKCVQHYCTRLECMTLHVRLQLTVFIMVHSGVALCKFGFSVTKCVTKK
jgi:hypothetical protein